MSFLDDLRASAADVVTGVTDTVSSGLQLAARDKVAQELSRHGVESNHRAETLITGEPAPAPPSGPQRSAQLQAEHDDAGGLKMSHLFIAGGLAALIFIARRSR